MAILFLWFPAVGEFRADGEEQVDSDHMPGGLESRVPVMEAKLDRMCWGFSREMLNWIDFLPEYGYV